MSLMLPTTARRLSDPSKFGTHTVFDDLRFDWLREGIASNTLPNRQRTRWLSIANLPASYTAQGVLNPWDIPENYGNEDPDAYTEMMDKIRGDYKNAVGYAIRYRLYGAEADALQVAKIIQAYSAITEFKTNAGSTLNWFDGWGCLIQAAMMVRNSASYTSAIATGFRNVLRLALATLEPIAYTRPNNWGAWGLAMEIAVSGFLNDRARFDRAIFRWRTMVNETVVSGYVVDNGGVAQGQIKNNVCPAEHYRMGGGQGNGAYGLLYTAFHLDGLTMAAEWARINGEWLFDHVTPDGSSLKGLWENVSYMRRHASPALSLYWDHWKEVQWYNTSWQEEPTHHYWLSGFYTDRVGGSFHILHRLWPNQHSQELLYGGFSTRVVTPAEFPRATADIPVYHNTAGYAVTQDYYGLSGADIMYFDRPLWG